MPPASRCPSPSATSCAGGHAIECRINAEDPAGGRFLPSPGTISRLRVPDGIFTRFDGGDEAGDEVSQYYDNLLGKLITWGRDREEARRRMLRALAELDVAGVATTVPAHKAILAHPDFVAGQHSTRWVEERLDLTGVAAAPAALPADGVGDGDGPAKVRKDLDVEVAGRRFSVSLWVEDTPVVAAAAGTGRARPKPSAAATAGGAAGAGRVTVPMPGTIVKVLVAVGDAVEVGQAVAVLEAMKMENQIAAEKSGTATDVNVAAGQPVGAGDVIIEIGD